jgi:GDPmannose 4,6-dehydratase
VSKTALITGITGQDGAYLASLLLKKGYQVHGLRQPVAMPDMDRLDAMGVAGQIHLHYGDLLDANSITNLIKKINPDEIYNLAAQSHVHISFDTPDQTLQVNGAGTLRILDSIRLLGLSEKVKFFQASTSELFGDAPPPQHETTRMAPRSPYAAAKLYSYHITRIYREAYGIHASNGIMFNHESPLRGGEFVTRKIAVAVAKIINGDQDVLMLGNLDAHRDWSHARDIMQAVWLMLQQKEPDDYVLASGLSHTVRDFATEAFAVAGIPLDWRGSGLHEIAVDAKSGRTLIRIDPALFRPLEVENLLGDPSKARARLQWQCLTQFREIVRELVNTELDQFAGKDSVRLKSYG